MCICCAVVDEIGEKSKKNFKEKLQEFSSRVHRNSKAAFTYRNVSKRLPILKWLPAYTTEDCVGDLLAGITVGLAVIPQSMAYSALAGLPPQVYLFFVFFFYVDII